MLRNVPDYDQILRRMDAFWHGELVDRPVCTMGVAKPARERLPEPPSHHATSAERWQDAEYQAELHRVRIANTVFLGDALPVAMPNLGPEIFASFYGCPIHFGDVGTSWTDPILEEWGDADDLTLDWQSPYLQKMEELTDVFIERGRGLWITGMTDWHPGGDAVAALRDPQRLAVDLITNPDDVQRLLVRLEKDYWRVYEHFYQRLRAAGLPITSWIPLVHEGRYYIPQNDFSCMISPGMFAEFFLDGIRRECQHLDRSIYHLDGPAALRHLDALLAIPELHAIQWVYGAGNEGYERWVPVYRRIQQAGKGMQVSVAFDEVPQVIETLDPHGVYLSVGGVPSVEAGEALLRELERWCTGKVYPVA